MFSNIHQILLLSKQELLNVRKNINKVAFLYHYNPCDAALQMGIQILSVLHVVTLANM